MSRRSLGGLGGSPKRPIENAKAGTFAFGEKLQSGRSITVKPQDKKKHTMMTTKLESINQSKKMNMQSTFRTTIKNMGSEPSDVLTKEMSLEA